MDNTRMFGVETSEGKKEEGWRHCIDWRTCNDQWRQLLNTLGKQLVLECGDRLRGADIAQAMRHGIVGL